MSIRADRDVALCGVHRTSCCSSASSLASDVVCNSGIVVDLESDVQLASITDRGIEASSSPPCGMATDGGCHALTCLVEGTVRKQQRRWWGSRRWQLQQQQWQRPSPLLLILPLVLLSVLLPRGAYGAITAASHHKHQQQHTASDMQEAGEGQVAMDYQLKSSSSSSSSQTKSSVWGSMLPHLSSLLSHHHSYSSHHGFRTAVVKEGSLMRASKAEAAGGGAKVAYLLSGKALDGNGFYLTVNVGYEQQPMNLLLDTTSDLFWVSCDCIQCSKSSASPLIKKSPVMDTTKSVTQVSANCTSSTCVDFSSAAFGYIGCNVATALPGKSSSCQFNFDYSFGSSSGRLIYDTIAIKPSGGDVTQQYIIMGCGQLQTDGLAGKTRAPDGIAGFGNGKISLVSQLGSYGVLVDMFSFCLEGDQNVAAGGYIIMGFSDLPAGAQAAPIEAVDSPRFNLPLIGMSVAGAYVDIPKAAFVAADNAGGGGSYFDTTITWTQLPADAHTQFISAVISLLPGLQFDKLTSKQRSLSCFAASSFAKPDEASFFAQFPIASLVFSNGAKFLLPPNVYLTANPEKGSACFTAVQAETSSTIIGTAWLRNKFILVDKANSYAAWVDLNCTSGEVIKVEEPKAPPFSPPTVAPPAVFAPPRASPPPPSPPAPKVSFFPNPPAAPEAPVEVSPISSPPPPEIISLPPAPVVEEPPPATPTTPAAPVEEEPPSAPPTPVASPPPPSLEDFPPEPSPSTVVSPPPPSPFVAATPPPSVNPSPSINASPRISPPPPSPPPPSPPPPSSSPPPLAPSSPTSPSIGSSPFSPPLVIRVPVGPNSPPQGPTNQEITMPPPPPAEETTPSDPPSPDLPTDTPSAPLSPSSPSNSTSPPYAFPEAPQGSGSCPPSPSDCSCFFEGSESSILKVPMSSLKPDSVFSPPIVCDLGLGENATVGTINSGSVQTLCDEGSNKDLGSQFYMNGKGVAARTFQAVPGPLAFADLYVQVTISSMQAFANGTVINMGNGDSPNGTGAKLCVIFQTTMA